MKQFYELYEGNEKVSPLVTQLSWTNHLLIMSGCKTDEEREFYIRLAIKERYTKRQLERQMDSGYYERYMLSKEKLLPEKVQAEINPFLDSYVIEFLDLPTGFLEKDLRKGLIAGMKHFMLEIGKDFINYSCPIRKCLERNYRNWQTFRRSRSINEQHCF